MECPKCGVELKEEQRVCVRCGFVIGQATDVPSIAVKKKNQVWHRYVGLVVILIVVIGSISVLFLNNHRKESRIIPVASLVKNKDEVHYINDLYVTDSRHYQYMLDDYQKEIYLGLLNAIVNFSTNFFIDTTSIETRYKNDYVTKVVDALEMDHPELIQFSHINIVKQTIDTMTVNIIYVFPNEEAYLDGVRSILNSISDLKDKSHSLKDYEKSQLIYDYLGKNNIYGSLDIPSSESAYSCFNKDLSPISIGYAKASQILFQNLGVDSILVSALVDDQSYMLNFVKLDGHYYYFDVSLSRVGASEDFVQDGFLSKKHGQYSLLYKDMIPWILGSKY